jgi:hypothetical protein
VGKPSAECRVPSADLNGTDLGSILLPHLTGNYLNPEVYMDQTTYASRLRYLDADDLDDSVVDFDGLDVRDDRGEKLGEVDGFLVDPGAGRVLYTVIDSGGWFTSRRFLVPIGHVAIDREGPRLAVDLSRDRLRQFPEFNESRFRDLSDDDLRAYERRMATVCCPEDLRSETPAWQHDVARHYRQPEWWSAGTYTASRLRPIEGSSFRTRAAAAASASVPVRESFDRERVVARADERGRDDRTSDDVSPHFGGRAQPGDVLGLETGGETTGIGDTAEDENRRRRAAERSDS